MADDLNYPEDFTHNTAPMKHLEIAGDEHRSNRKAVQLENANGPVDANNPISTDGDSVYEKDVNSNSSLGTFTGSIIGLFNDYTAIINVTDISAANPKTFTVVFNRPIETDSIGIGSATQKLSNVKILLQDQFGNDRAIVDDSANDTKYSSNVYSFEPEVFIQAKFEFHTDGDIELSGLFITKDAHVTARIEAQKPDGTSTLINATAGGNLKVSVEEVEISKDLEGGGDVTIGTSQVEIVFTGSTKSIIISADDSNTGIIFIGKTGILSDGSNQLVKLKNGDDLILTYNDETNALFAISDTTAQKISIGALL